MKIVPLLTILVAAFAATAPAQTQNPVESMTRPRTVSLPSQQGIQSFPAEGKRNLPEVTPHNAPESNTVGNIGSPSVEARDTASSERDLSRPAARDLSVPFMRSRITEAERLLKSRPMQTALAAPSIQFVTLAALERNSSRVHLITISKETFLARGSEVTLPTSLGTPVNIRILRANGVNTAVTIFDNLGNSLVPLVVEFPIEKRGLFREMAYYTSAHPSLLTPELVRSGQTYVHTMIDLAWKRLRESGAFISPPVVDLAERLCLVEHVDHERFRQENHEALFNEIYSLYGLNELDTYRYSVSSAGAGGMVQMIPWAYNLIRQRHPAVGLTPDFVAGMRNHANALQAMLLYLQDTWNDLAANPDVQSALSSKIATQNDLLAAGYNSNAARLPLYLRRGESAWRTLVPRETQMYLQIYKTLDALVPMKPRKAPALQRID